MKKIINAVIKRIVYATRTFRAIAVLVHMEIKYCKNYSFFFRIKSLLKGFTSQSYHSYSTISATHLKYCITDFDRRKRLNYINEQYGILFGDKLLTYFFLNRYLHLLPKLFYVVKNGKMYFNTNYSFEKEAVFENVKSTLQKQTKLILKPTTSFGGNGVVLLEYENDFVSWNGEKINQIQFETKISKLQGEHVITSFIAQTGYANKIYPNSVNTIRMLTIYDNDTNECWLAGAAHRFGTLKSGIVDNGTNGGVSTNIDLDTGKLGNTIIHFENKHFKNTSVHPDTKQQIEGILISNWKHIVESVIELAIHSYKCTVVGWDIAVSENGFSIIEANNSPDTPIMQLHVPILKNKRNRKFFKKHGII